MDVDRFDRLVLTLTRARTRRSVLGLLAALGLTGLVAWDVAAQTCLANGTRCGRATDPACCSGRCVRKQGTNKRFCRAAPNQGICTIESDVCTATGSPGCADGGGSSCVCWVTTRGYSFCGVSGSCVACNTDADCEKRRRGQPGDRCVKCAGDCSQTSNRACIRKCPNPATP